MKIRKRLAWYGAGVTAVGLIVFGGLLLVIARGGVIDTQDTALDTLVAQAVTNLESGDDPHTSLRFVREASLESLYLEVLGADGALLAHSATTTPIRVPAAVVVEAAEQGASTLELDGGERIRAKPWTGPSLSGVVAGIAPSGSVEAELGPVRILVFTSALLTLIAATIVSWLVSGRALRPLRELAETTDEIGATGDLTQRLPPVESDDEVGALTVSFNAMLDQLETSQRQLGETLGAQQRFVADASHELRSPLTTIRSNAGFLAERPEATDDDRAEAVLDIRAEADRMAVLVDDLLMLARGDAGRQLQTLPVDLAELGIDAARRAQRIGWDVTCDSAGPAVTMGDVQALERVVWILVDNAVKHGAPPVKVSVRSDEARVRISISDGGDGIPVAQLSHVFDRFHRTDVARSAPGSGLGLSIARDVVLRHNGMLSASAPDSGGAVFTAEFEKA